MRQIHNCPVCKSKFMYLYTWIKIIEQNIPASVPVSKIESIDRDNDLADIFNTTETKSDLFIWIINYLVKKWFLLPKPTDEHNN